MRWLIQLTYGSMFVHVPVLGRAPRGCTSTLVGRRRSSHNSAGRSRPTSRKGGNVRRSRYAEPRASTVIPNVRPWKRTGVQGHGDRVSGSAPSLPSGTPREIVELLQRRVRRQQVRPDVKERLAVPWLRSVAGNVPGSRGHIKAESRLNEKRVLIKLTSRLNDPWTVAGEAMGEEDVDPVQPKHMLP